MLKRAGYDMIIVQGCAARPLYLMITEEKAELKDASHLWGLSVGETTEQIRLDHKNKRLQVATIGQAGENMVCYACVINGFEHEGAAELKVIWCVLAGERKKQLRAA